MNLNQAPIKTSKGLEEIAKRTHKLPAEFRQILIMVNGQATITELVKKLSKLGEIESVLAQLEMDGFIAPNPAFTLPETSRQPTLKTPQSQMCIRDRLTTTQCLLNPNRNGLDRATLEQRLGEMLGINRYLWLENGYLLGDDTDSHIDTLARFCDARTLAYQGCTDPTDPHYAALQAMAEELRSFRTASGEPYRLIELPLPAARHDERGNRLPAGYANFLIVNGAVLVPAYGDPLDAVALERLSGCFPNHEIKGVPCATLVRQGGSLHCATMQLPAGVMPAAANPA